MKYVPILRAKSGEFSALKDQKIESKTAMTPLLQLVPDTAEKRVRDYFASQVEAIKKAWNFDGNSVFVDPTLYYPETIELSFPYFELLRNEGINCLPVVSLNSPDKYINFIREGEFYRDGVCIRVKQDFSLPRLVNMTIEHYRREFNLNLDQIDLMIDFGYLGDTSNAHYFNSFQEIYTNLQNPNKLRNIIIASGSFPVDVSKYVVGSIEELPRSEWALWEIITGAYPDFNFTYSDYGCAHPTYDAYAQAFPGSCSIKYTASSAFYVFRGARSDLHKDGFGQYISHSKALVERPFYPGPSFSWADTFIHECAQKNVDDGKAGNAEKWVKVSQNHHFALILSLL